MTDWTAEQLTAIGDAGELLIAPKRADGTLRRIVIIWAVRIDDDIYIRSANGKTAGWYRHTAETHRARITSAGVTTDVTLEDASGDDSLTAPAHRLGGRQYPGIAAHHPRRYRARQRDQ